MIMEHLFHTFQFDFKLAIHNIMYSDLTNIRKALNFLDTCINVYDIDEELIDKYLEEAKLQYMMLCSVPEYAFIRACLGKEDALESIFQSITHQYQVYLIGIQISL